MPDMERLEKILGKENIRTKEPLSKHTTFRIGGSAEVFVTPDTLERFEDTLSYLRREGESYFILGNGSNLLVSDRGFPGVIVATHVPGRGSIHAEGFGIEEYMEGTREETEVLLESILGQHTVLKAEEGKHFVAAGSGILLSTLANGIAGKGYRGFEFAAGIPGTLGGAVTMNAGAYGGEIKDVLLGAVVLLKDGEKRFLTTAELELGYRSSLVQKEDMIVLLAVFTFDEGNPEEIRQTIQELNRKRKEKQPLNYGSAGSTFKRPEGYFAGKLIEDAGLKGYRVGDVMVSEKHAGFVVNVGEGTCEQALSVIRHVREQVKESFGVDLEPEIKILA